MVEHHLSAQLAWNKRLFLGICVPINCCIPAGPSLRCLLPMQVSGIETHTCTGVIWAKVGHPLITLSGAGVGDEQTFLWPEYVEQQVLAVFFFPSSFKV